MKHGDKLSEVGTIPNEWEFKQLLEIAQVKTGPFGTLLRASEYSGSDGVPLISVGEIGMGKFKVSVDTPLVPDVVLRRLPQYILRAGDIVFGRKGAVDRSVLVTEKETGWFLGSDGIAITPARENFPQYLAFQFQRYEIRSWLLQNAIGTTMASLNQSIIGKIKIPLAPLNEQRTIASALSDVDALLAALDRLIAKKRDLKQAAMQQLLTGQTRLPGFKGEWTETQLGKCLSSSPKYGINAAAVSYSDKLPTYIRITDISEHGRFQPQPKVSVQANGSSQYFLQEGDIVFARTGASVGKSYLYDPKDGELVFAGFLIKVCANRKILLPEFLAAYVTSKKYWDWVSLMSMRSGQPGINGNEYSRFPILLPSLEEQKAIAAIMANMDSELLALEQRLAKTRALKQGMMQELLTGRIRLVTPQSSPKVAHA